MSVLDDFFGDSSNDDYISPDTIEKAKERHQKENEDRQSEAEVIYNDCKANDFSRAGLRNWQINLMIEFGFAYDIESDDDEYGVWDFVK